MPLSLQRILPRPSQQSSESASPFTRRDRSGFFASLRMTTVSVWLFMSVWVGVGAAEPQMRISPKKIRDEVHAAVETQLNALREGNFEEAYEMASEGIKSQFDVRLYAALIRR